MNKEEINNQELKEKVNLIFQSLFSDSSDHDRDIQILFERFGLDGKEPRTYEEIGKEFNLTREEVRKIEVKWIRALRKTQSLRKS